MSRLGVTESTGLAAASSDQLRVRAWRRASTPSVGSRPKSLRSCDPIAPPGTSGSAAERAGHRASMVGAGARQAVSHDGCSVNHSITRVVPTIIVHRRHRGIRIYLGGSPSEPGVGGSVAAEESRKPSLVGGPLVCAQVHAVLLITNPSRTRQRADPDPYPGGGGGARRKASGRDKASNWRPRHAQPPSKLPPDCTVKGRAGDGVVPALRIAVDLEVTPGSPRRLLAMSNTSHRRVRK